MYVPLAWKRKEKKRTDENPRTRVECRTET